jgi:RNA polymerase primary sigma factor
VERNLRLVVWVAKSFRGRGFDFIDLIQEGNLGLMRAVDRFDPAVGARFSTFATHWIQQGIRRALAEKARMIRIPVNRIPEVRQTLYARAHLAEELDRQPRPEEIAKEIGLPTHKVEELLPAIAPIDSMDAPLGSSERKLGDLLEDRTTPTPLDDAMEAETQRAIRAVLHELPDRQRVILCMRHGIGYPRECTLEEIGDELGLSRERIRQVEKVAAASVRDWLQEHRPQLATPV